jgi:hypothetical protein
VARVGDAGLDEVAPKLAKRCCYQVRTCVTAVEALGIASVAPADDYCVGVLCGPSNSRVGSAVGRATVVLAGWDAWRRACDVRKVDTSTQVEARVTVVNLGVESEGRLLVC